MQFVLNLFIVLHFLGLALLFGGFIVQVKSAEKGVSRWMLDGALTQLVTGIVMVGIIESKVIDDMQPSSSFHAKIGVKLLVVLVITVLAIIGRRKKGPQPVLWGIIGLLTLANIVIAVFWN
ncbi:unannotated protein [freshwater metagenome]|uniref:Unannotated protein n=1 Tax=freshwater metagenome TaxID=449393 RepID=A0A6J7I4N5_9ZZZZ|nr:hypothetical protein [Actinomycetota bacterium]